MFPIMQKILSCTIGLLFSVILNAQQPLPYKDPSLPVEQRVQDLLHRMTPEEKFWQLFMIPGNLSDGKEKYRQGIFGFQVGSTGDKDAAGQRIVNNEHASAVATARQINAIQKFFIEETRLGIPFIAFEEALHGLVKEGSTIFPQAIALAATWDTAQVAQTAQAIAEETRRQGIRDVLSPVVNIASDVRWGRTEETYGEDPFLCAEMGVAFVTAFEKKGIVTTPKHFLANSGDGGRDSYPADYNERLLEEYFLPPFKACIERGGSRSIMTSYNSLNGQPASANNWLLNQKLKTEMQFNGFVISDASSIGGANVLHFTAADYADASAKAMNQGMGVIFQTDYDHHRLFIPPFLDGRIPQPVIDSAVARVLRVKFNLGLFEHPYADETEAASIPTATHRAIARKTALKSIVLLKNEHKTLPFSSNLPALAIIGTDATEARTGGYSANSQHNISILKAIQELADKNTRILYAPGCGRSGNTFVPVPASALSHTEAGVAVPALDASYFNNIQLKGTPVLKRMDEQVNFRWTLYAPDPSIQFDFFSASWTGSIQSPESGNYRIGIEGNDGYRLYLNNQLLIDNWKSQTYSTRLVPFQFEKNKRYAIRIEFFESSGYARLKLVWNVGLTQNWNQKIDEAVAAAQKATAAVIVTGIEEGEGSDRAYLGLPGHQEELIRRVAALGKPLVVVLTGGSAITMNNWIDRVPAVLDCWYPGEQGGYAVAEVLLGRYNPAGRLPITFPVFEGQLPLVYNHKPTGRTDDYVNLNGQPLFPFGFGLSYTRFTYDSLRFSANPMKRTDTITVLFTLKNTGSYDGDEVVQLYIRDLLASTVQPIKQLKGFQRIHLAAGESKSIRFQISVSDLKMLNPQMQWVTEPGDFRIMIGASSKDIRLRGILSLLHE